MKEKQQNDDDDDDDDGETKKPKKKLRDRRRADGNNSVTQNSVKKKTKKELDRKDGRRDVGVCTEFVLKLGKQLGRTKVRDANELPGTARNSKVVDSLPGRRRNGLLLPGSDWIFFSIFFVCFFVSDFIFSCSSGSFFF